MEWITRSAKFGKLSELLYKWFIMKTVLPLRQQLSPRVYRVLGIMTLQGTNTYLIGTGRNRVLVDTSSSDYPEYVQSLKIALDELQVQIEKVIVTHWHHDHVGGIVDLMREGVVNTATPISKIPFPLKDDPTGLKFTPLSDGQKITVEGATLQVIATPGHTKDHLCLVLEEEQAIFSGDCILGEGSSVFEEFGPYMESLRRIETYSPEIIYPGHGPVIAHAVNKVKAYIEHRLIREKQIMECLERDRGNGLTALEIVEKVYGQEIPKFKYPAAKINVEHHLSKLIEDGCVEKRKRQEGIIGVEDIYVAIAK
ncbi:endoribonuclease LACTB2-like isoform X2 [Varroa destructor]|uniref:Beta-lactamase-like protein 2 homolog n=1 Tax=Varroa destructor TaxID=109461 RepID=A0A7M7KM70_VARDE|nr:endoribonuclease LACTB2-like isoform X2 [Varroa destructor]